MPNSRKSRPVDRRRGGVTSARKIRANRANARASSGPKTAAGKAQSAQNAFHSTRSREVARFLALLVAANGFFLLRFFGIAVLACTLCRP